MPSCARCSKPTDYSASVDHPAPFKGLWLCRPCLLELGGYQTIETLIAQFAALEPRVRALEAKEA